MRQLRQEIMDSKRQMLELLKEELTHWERMLAGLRDEQITDREVTEGRSVKDIIAHLMAWQQVSIARLEAARREVEPELPEWLGGSDPEDEDNIDLYNDRIYETYRDQPWSEVFQSWRRGFLRFLEAGEAVPEEDLVNDEKYPWLKGYPPLAVLEGSSEHHKEHRESIESWLGKHG
jgi:hypothetical protein